MVEMCRSANLADIDARFEYPITTQPTSLTDSETEDVLAFLSHYKYLIIQRDSDTHYRFFNSKINQRFFVVEKSNHCDKMLLGRRRSIEYTIYDNNGVEAMFIERPWFCCWPTMLVYTPARQLYVRRLFIGQVKKRQWTCKPVFDITNIVGCRRLRVKGQFSQCECCCSLRFEILKCGEAGVIGAIKRELRFTKNMRRISDLNHVGCRFPKNLKNTQKALLMAVTMLIHSRYIDGSCMCE